MLLRDLGVLDCLLLLRLRAAGQGFGLLPILGGLLLERGGRLRLLFRELGMIVGVCQMGGGDTDSEQRTK